MNDKFEYTVNLEVRLQGQRGAGPAWEDVARALADRVEALAVKIDHGVYASVTSVYIDQAAE